MKLVNVFQFHKGTIKTTIELQIPQRVIYFNSIKVQLRRTVAILALVIWKFQFHKGTIKTLAGEQSVGGNALFQFHKGTIKTKMVSAKHAWRSPISIP